MIPTGARAYSTVAIESGWLPSPLPAIYTGEKMLPYRKWLKASTFEGVASLGGSFDSTNIEDYYLTPWDIGYDHLIRFDHDFIGRDALQKLAKAPHRKKVTLTWDSNDVVRTFATLFQRESRAKYLEMPASQYSTHPYDKVLVNDKLVGISTYSVYTSNGRAWISLAVVDEELAKTGTEVVVRWGEANGGSQKPTVERHIQTDIRATVGPSPYSEAAREHYRPYSLK
jgi:glycine cleavage system aminomethyltransferase T